ncbi:unnamed protein product [Caenorhabditis auriculariae]|uniref:AMP deaminase 2 n=1 Tax=Caenorhabditis auriculariae TaxID=2777116 RepID=A0A8S1HI38_9PELO|nr:unnamed protein product [Caenorhabditis auriculariae]
MASRCAAHLIKRVLMVPPQHFTVEYAINPWMGGVVDKQKAQKQWNELKSAIEAEGVQVLTLDQTAGLPDQVFVCNSGLVYEDKVYLARFRHKERNGEEPHYLKWFKANGFKLHGEAKEDVFEGGGDAVFTDPNTLWAGYGERSSKGVYEKVKALGKFDVVMCDMVLPNFYHLDTCFAPVDATSALYYPKAFSEKTQQEILRRLPNSIAVSEEEASAFVCNAITIRDSVLSPIGVAPKTREALARLGKKVKEIDMSEFMKSGGACQLQMPEKTNGVKFYNPPDSEEQGAESLVEHHETPVSPLDSVADYSLSNVGNMKKIRSLNSNEDVSQFSSKSPNATKSEEKENGNSTKSPPLKERCLNRELSESAYTMCGVSSAFAPVPQVTPSVELFDDMPLAIEPEPSTPLSGQKMKESKESLTSSKEKKAVEDRGQVCDFDQQPQLSAVFENGRFAESASEKEPSAVTSTKFGSAGSNSLFVFLFLIFPFVLSDVKIAVDDEESLRTPRGIPSTEAVDSEVFDTGPFKPNYAIGTADHSTANPFEISTTPIEVNESRKLKTLEISNRARLESQNECCLSPGSVKSGVDLSGIDERCRSPQLIEMHTFRDAIDVNYQRMAITGEDLSGVPLEDLKTAAGHLIEALHLRSEYMERIGNQFPATTRYFLSGKYPKDLPRHRVKNTESMGSTSFNPPEPPKDHWGLLEDPPKFEVKYKLHRRNGVIEVCDDKGELCDRFRKSYITREKFLSDTEKLTAMIVDGPLKSFCYRRLSYLQNKFQLHVLLNELRELHEQKGVSHRDFYNIRKVDTHIHAASSMNQKHLLRFIKKKIKTEANTVVLEKDGKPVTMMQVFKKMGIDAYDLSVDMLDVHADRNTFHRFDKFNTKYNPVGESTLREIFIKTDNYVGGKYFAEVLKEVLSDLEDSKYQHAEPRLSIYGRSKDEWDKLAKWAITHDVWSPNVRWLIQIPRLYDIYRAKDMVKNFDQILDNIFTPLFEVTNDPSSHPMLYRFLQQVSGIDSVDDESKHEFVHFDRSTPSPPEYTDLENPPYNYYLFYMYANITALNAFRASRGMNTFSLRPHCGEAGHISHLLAGYLTSESIAHGILLRKVPVLQYLFYLTQMGIAMSPLSNNSLFISYQRNPLPEYLQKGLNVSLSTDDPLQFHYTKEALMEEYSIAAQVWKLSSCDMCELARNSVIQSGFEDKVKIHWLGPNYKEEGVLSNDIHRTNVPDIRVSFRHEALVDELTNLFRVYKPELA